MRQEIKAIIFTGVILVIVGFLGAGLAELKKEQKRDFLECVEKVKELDHHQWCYDKFVK